MDQPAFRGALARGGHGIEQHAVVEPAGLARGQRGGEPRLDGSGTRATRENRDRSHRVILRLKGPREPETPGKGGCLKPRTSVVAGICAFLLLAAGIGGCSEGVADHGVDRAVAAPAKATAAGNTGKKGE